jgi:hypothetical protein
MDKNGYALDARPSPRLLYQLCEAAEVDHLLVSRIGHWTDDGGSSSNEVQLPQLRLCKL